MAYSEETIIHPPSGTGGNSLVTLTNAATAYPVPAVAPTKHYSMVVHNNSETDIYWGFENTNANGTLIPPDGKVALDLGKNDTLYAYCASAGKTLQVTYKEII